MSPTALARLAVLACAALVGGSQLRGAEHAVEHWSDGTSTEFALVEDHRVPIVYGLIEFPVGHWSPWAVEHDAEEAFDIQLHDPEGELRARADELAVGLSVGMGAHASSIAFSCLTEDLEPALDLVRRVLSNRDFDRHVLRRWTQNEKLEWDASRKDPAFRIDQAAARLWYAEGDPRRRPYEKPPPNETRVDRLIAARDAVLRVPGRVVAFAGDLDRSAVERLSRELLPPVLAEVPAGLAPELAPLTTRDRLPESYTESMPAIAQTFFAYGRDSLTYDDPRYPAFLVADHVLGGHFFSRLYTALRHEGGETYGSATQGAGGVFAESYALTTFTRADNTAATEQKLRDVLRRFHSGGITEEERAAAVGYMRGQRPFEHQAPAQLLDRWLWERRHGLPHGFRDELVERAARASLEEINALIASFYDPARFTMVEVVPR